MRLRLAAGLLAGLFLIIYLPGIGHGFIQDDFRWILSARATSLDDLLAIFGSNVGFYRPLVTVSFAADYTAWGLHPFGYGLTNLLLALANAALVFALARRLGLGAAAALMAAAVWAFNFHGVNMALLWLSGRTALFVVLFALCTAHAVLGGAYRIAGMTCLAALLCKEEAVMLPALFSVFLATGDSQIPVVARIRRAVALTWPLWLALAIYAALRLQSGAFGVTTAPSYYRLSLAPLLVGRNLVEYLDRGATTAAAAALVLWMATGSRRPELRPSERRTLTFAGAWWIATYAITVFLPVRSSLYAVLPSIGPALAVGVLADATARSMPVRFERVVAALLVVVCLLVPVYRIRNNRWIAVADLSSRVMETVRGAAAGRSTGQVVLIDSPAERVNLDAMLGTLFPDAVALMVGPGWSGRVIAPADPLPPGTTLAFRFENGTLRPVFRAGS